MLEVYWKSHRRAWFGGDEGEVVRSCRLKSLTPREGLLAAGDAWNDARLARCCHAVLVTTRQPGWQSVEMVVAMSTTGPYMLCRGVWVGVFHYTKRPQCLPKLQGL